jgi:hypothetical protein
VKTNFFTEANATNDTVTAEAMILIISPTAVTHFYDKSIYGIL